MKVAELELAQMPPVFRIEDDAMDWMRFAQYRVGDPGVLKQLQTARVGDLRP
jgi:hypothetical protein